MSCASLCAIISLAILVATQRVNGCSVDCCSESGIVVLAPSTELVEANTKCSRLWWRQSSRMRRKPVKLLLTYAYGLVAA